MSQIQISGEAKIRDLQGPVVANSGVITALDGAASQYVRGDGTLADFPTATGGGSSVSYYLNGSVNQGTFGGSTYYQMSKNAITGTGTNFSTSADGLLAQFITDANDPDATSIPSGNWNIEFFMNVSASSGALASFYVEFYKYNGTTFTLVATNVATPEVLTGTTTIDAYYTSVAFPETALLQTDRLAIRIYANVASKTVTLYTEDNRLCQVVTTFSRGILSLNNLTDQQQYFAVGTSGSDFNIVSSLDTHTFNIPTASATKRGLLSTTDWSTFNNKVPYTGATGNVDLGTNNLFASFLYAEGAGGTSNGGLLIKQYSGAITAGVGYTSLFAPINQLGINFGGAYNALIEGTTLSANRTFTLPNITGTFALLQGNQNFIGFKQFSDTNSTWLDYGISMAKGSTPSSLSSSRVNVYSNSGDKNLVIADTFASFAKLQFQATGDLTYTFPSSSGTIALTSNLSSYVPYTGATTNVNLGFNLLTTNSINLDGNSASGVLNIKSNSSISTSGAGYVSLVSGNVNQLSFVFNGGNSATFTSVSLSASRTYSLPDASGTISLTSDLSAYVTLSTNQTISGQKIFSSITTFSGVTTFNQTVAIANTSSITSTSGFLTLNSSLVGSISSLTLASSSTNVAKFSFNNTAVRTYTLPDSDGTIALTSNLSSYLPLTGGTLTGALSGTSATFSGNVGIGVTPSAWSGLVAIQSAYGVLAGNNQSNILLNAYYDGSYKYVGTGEAARYRQDAGVHSWLTAPSGTAGNAISFTQAMTLASTGNLLVGTTTDAGYKLDVNGTGRFSDVLYSTKTSGRSFGNDSYGTNFGWIAMYGTTQGIQLGFEGTTGGQLITGAGANYGILVGKAGLAISANNGGTNHLNIASTGAATFSSSVSSSGSGFFASNLQSNGVLTIGNQNVAGNYCLQIYPSTTTPIQLQGILAGVGASAIVLQPSGGNVGIGTSSPSYQLQLSTDSAAKPTSALWTIASDERIKENINPYNKGLQELLQINPITYDYNGLGGFKKGKGGVGIIAQEIMNILPDSVSSIKAKLNEEDEAEIDILNFNGHELTYILINAIKEQQAQIELLSNKIVALESK